MNRRLILQSGSIRLRSIGEADLEDLRSWKNANRQAFFFKEEITPAGQKAWFQGYLGRPHDYMFIVEAESLRAGCMGFRLKAETADCYNIIGAPEGRSKGLMTWAMKTMCSYILEEHALRIGCRVLKTNPAVGWYQKCGYVITAEQEDYYQMDLDQAFQTVEYSVMGAGK